MFNFILSFFDFTKKSDTDSVMDIFYSKSFTEEGQYLKNKRASLIDNDKVSKKLLVNNPNRAVSLRTLPFKSISK